MKKVRIALFEASSPIWPKVLEALAPHGFEVVYWTGASDSEKEVNKYSACIFQSQRDARLGKPFTGTDNSAHFNGVSETVWTAGHQTVLKQMDRFGLYADDFGLSEREALFLKYLSTWGEFFEGNNVDLLVFPTPPHAGYDYVAYLLGKAMGMPIIVFNGVTVLAPYVQLNVKENLQARALASGAIDEWLLTAGTELPKPLGLSELPKVQGPEEILQLYQSDMAAHRQVQTGSAGSELTFQSLKALIRVLVKIAAGLSSAIPLFKERGKLLEHSFSGRTGKMRFSFSVLQQAARAVFVKLHYERIVHRQPVSGASTIYLPLSYQPEVVSNPLGGVYENMELLIRQILSAMPAGYLLLVREHPGQFLPGRQVAQIRQKDWYDRISKLPSVRLVSTNRDPLDLIDQARITISAGGTSLIQAVFRGKPAVLVGSAWFETMPGIYNVRSFHEMSRHLGNLDGLKSASDSELINFLRRVETGALGAMVDYPYLSYENGSEEPFAVAEKILTEYKRRGLDA